MRISGKPPVPRYHYKLATVTSSREAEFIERALRDRLRNSGLSFFAICRPGGTCDVMGDSGTEPLLKEAIANARSAAVEVSGAFTRPNK